MRVARVVTTLILVALAIDRHAAETIGKIATIQTFDGEHLGPYIVEDFHSHDYPDAQALEGSGDDTEGGDDPVDGAVPSSDSFIPNRMISPVNMNKPLEEVIALNPNPEIHTSDESKEVIPGNLVKPDLLPLPIDTSEEGIPQFIESSNEELPVPSEEVLPVIIEGSEENLPETEESSVETVPELNVDSAETIPEPIEGSEEKLPEPIEGSGDILSTNTAVVTEKITAAPENPVPSATMELPVDTDLSSQKPPLPSVEIPVVTDNLCHETCLQQLQTVQLSVLPQEHYFREGQSVAFACSASVKKNGMNSLTLRWIFEPLNPPDRECSLDDQDFLAKCEGFNNVRQLTDSNQTNIFTTLFVSGLTLNNTGRFLCQAEMDCCNSRPQHQLDYNILVWQVDYTKQLITMGGIAAALLVVVVVISVLKSRAQTRQRDLYKQVLIPVTSEDNGYKPASHQPYIIISAVDETDSFSSTESITNQYR